MTDITPSMTIGPFFHFAMTEGFHGKGDIVGANMVTPDAAGERIRIVGRVIDGKGLPLTGAQHVAHQHAVDVPGLQPGLGYGGPDRGAAEVRG